METNHISQNEVAAKDASPRVYGTPTVTELQMRVQARQLERKKKGARK